MSWTEERVETLKRMWGEGQSASQIAKELGGVTRNAVIGKVHRLGLSNRAALPEATATPEAVAEDIYRGWRKGRNVLYSKPVWRLVMLIIRLLPEALFKRTRI